MIIFSIAMVKGTLERIKQIEARAEGIIKTARQDALLLLKKTRQQQENDLRQQQARLKQERQKAVRAAEAEATAEAARITAASAQQIKEIKKAAQSKIPEAKKEILQCLS